MIRLVPAAGPQAGRPVELAHGARLGRLADCELPIAHASVSRLHARVEMRDGRAFLVDAGSRNGLFDASGRRVDEVELVPGAEVRLGDFELTVAAPDGGAAVIDEDLEFELDAGDVGPAEGAATSSATPGGATGDDDFELEDPAEIELGAGGRAPASKPVAAKAPASNAATAHAPAAAASARDRSAQYLAEESRARSGLVRGELTQQPLWMQGLVFAGVLLFGAAIAYGVFAAVA